MRFVAASKSPLRLATDSVARAIDTVAQEQIMSRIAPLEPPYDPVVQSHFDRIMRGAPPLMLFRVIAAMPAPGTNSAQPACWTGGRYHSGSARSSLTVPVP